MPPSEQSEQKYNTGVADSEDTLASLLAVQQPGRHLPPVPVGRPYRQSASCEGGAVGGDPDYKEGPSTIMIMSKDMFISTLMMMTPHLQLSVGLEEKQASIPTVKWMFK